MTIKFNFKANFYSNKVTTAFCSCTCGGVVSIYSSRMELVGLTPMAMFTVVKQQFGSIM